MLSPVDDRLAALWEQRQIEIVSRCDMIAVAVGRIVDRARNEMLAVIASGGADFNTYRRIERIYRGIIPDVVAYLNAVLPGLVRYSDKDARRRLIRTVPRAWWRVKWPLLEHMGPGPHPNGSPQSVHGRRKGKHTDSDEFKRWFGKSKVVDDHGEPLVVYHGTNANFADFDRSKAKANFDYSFGLYFSSSKQDAGEYGKTIIPVYLKITNPLRVKAVGQSASWKLDLDRAEIIQQILASRKTDNPYDGVISTDEDGLSNYVVFDANQVRRADQLKEAEPAGGSPLDRILGPKSFTLDDLIGKEPVYGQKLSSDEFRKLMDEVLIPPLTESQVEAIVKSPNPHTGDSWEKRLTDLSSKVQSPEQVAGEIINGMAMGESVKPLRDRIDKHVGKLHGSSMRIARTEARRVAAKAGRQSLIQALGDLLDGWLMVAILDERTRPEHAHRNGTVYRKGGTPAFEDAPDVPDAPNCRCDLAPVLKTPGEVLSNPAVAQTFKNDSGSRIPDPVAYEDWFRRADERRRRKAVGSRRYDVVKKQKPEGQQPEWSDFIGKDGKLIPVTVLKQGGESALARKVEVGVMLAQRRSDFLAITQAPFVPTSAPVLPRALPTAVQAAISITKQQQRQMRRLAQRIVAGEVTRPEEQLRLARAIAPSKTDAELRQLIDLAIAGFFGGR